MFVLCLYNRRLYNPSFLLARTRLEQKARSACASRMDEGYHPNVFVQNSARRVP